MNVSKKLLEKYNKPIPRYTSYPPANFFKDGFEHDKFKKAIIKSNSENPKNISIYIHIPFCQKICHYCGCNNSNMRGNKDIKAYINALLSEMKLVFANIDKNRKVSQIHYGGGTPNAIEVAYLAEINNYIFSSFSMVEGAEVAIECNPAHLTEKYIESMFEAGFNRYSIGIQDFRTDVLKIINRDPSYIPVPELIKLLKHNNTKASVNLDFIYGLPLQTSKSFADSVQKGIEAGADRIVTFSYAHVPWVNKAQKILEKVGLPSEIDKINMFEAGYNLLTSNKYRAIGLDHYALETDSLSIAQENGQLHRNFQGYCTKETTGQVYAFGVSAISQFESAYIQNTKDIDDYIQLTKNKMLTCKKGYVLNKEELFTRRIIDKIMCNKELYFKELLTTLDINNKAHNLLLSSNNLALRELAKDNIIELTDEYLKINEDNILFIRNVASSFDPLVRNSEGHFSKPI